MFFGSLPNIDTDALADFNVSNNNLTGSIPDSLSKFPESSFAGNPGLCGAPLRSCNPVPPSPAPSTTSGENSKKLSTSAIIAIAVGSAIVALLFLSLFLIICLRKQKRRLSKRLSATAMIQAEKAGTSSSKDDITGGSKEVERMNKLVFSEGSVYRFHLEDLLRASAEVLGKGSVGTSYKVVLAEGKTVVVKRLKDMAVSKREFDMKMKMYEDTGEGDRERRR
ncbi:hypothetical protein GQ457_15G013620 [Hibiscus cannabinus]